MRNEEEQSLAMGLFAVYIFLARWLPCPWAQEGMSVG